MYDSNYTNMLKKSDSDPHVIGRKSRPEYGETVDETNDSDSDDDESVVSLDEDNEALWDHVSDDVDQREKKQKKKHENMFQRGILSRIFTAEPDVDDETFVERHIKRAVEFMRRDQNGELLSPGVVSKRFEYVCKSDLICGETLILFKEEYLRNRNNRGNTTAHNAPTNYEIEANNEVCDHYIETGKYFFVQCKVEEGYNKAGEGFVEPERGTKMKLEFNGKVYDKFVVKGKEMEIEYGIHPPAKLLPGIVFESVKGRLKPDKKKKNTNATKATNYHNTHIYNVPTYKQLGKYVRMIEPVSGKIPDGNVVLCWFERKESCGDAKMPAKKKTRRK